MTDEPQLSVEERLKRARERFEEIKQRKDVLVRHLSTRQTATGEVSDAQVPVLQAQNQDLQDQVKELKSTVEQQNSTIKKLRNEATELKLSKMDLEQRIEELQNQLSQLQPRSETKASFHSYQPQGPVAEQKEEVVDLKERIMKWKNWQVDMRTWNTATKASI